MKIRKLRQIEVSEIGMGCMGFSHGYGNAPERAYSIRATQEAYEYGCTFFDTAETYGTQPRSHLVNRSDKGQRLHTPNIRKWRMT